MQKRKIIHERENQKKLSAAVAGFEFVLEKKQEKEDT